MTQEEWEAAGSMHPPIAMRVKARSRLDRFFTVESADFGAHFRDMLGQTYSGRYGSQAPSRVAPIFILTDSANHLQCQELEDWGHFGLPHFLCGSASPQSEAYNEAADRIASTAARDEDVPLLRNASSGRIIYQFAPDESSFEDGLYSKLQGVLNMYNGKMVLNHRGSCEFCVKAKMAREAGARAVIVINNDESKFHIPVGACLLESWCATSQLIFPTCLGDGTVMPGYGVETRDEGNKNSGDGCNSK